jgi:hypothetical protein
VAIPTPAGDLALLADHPDDGGTIVVDVPSTLARHLLAMPVGGRSQDRIKATRAAKLPPAPKRPPSDKLHLLALAGWAHTLELAHQFGLLEHDQDDRPVITVDLTSNAGKDFARWAHLWNPTTRRYLA